MLFVGPVENSVYGAAFAVFFESERSVLFENFALFDTTSAFLASDSFVVATLFVIRYSLLLR